MRDNRTYIKVFHQMLEWGWYSDTNTFRVFMHILLRANYKPSEYLGQKIDAGECVFGYNAWSEELGLSVRELRTAISHLKSTNEIRVRATSRFSVITVVKWDFWQIEEGLSDKQATSDFDESCVKIKKNDTQSVTQATSEEIVKSIEILTNNGFVINPSDKQVTTQATSKRQASDKQATTSKESKNTTTKNKHSIGHPKLEDVRAYVTEKKLIIDPDYFFDYYETAGWVDNKGKRIQNWKLKALNWNKREEDRNGRKETDTRRGDKERTRVAGRTEDSGAEVFRFSDSI